MISKNITIQNQTQNNESETVIASSFDNFRKKITISLVVILLFFAYSDKIWAQIESLYNSSTEQFAGISTLMSATANNDIEGVRFFSEAGPSIINQRNKGGATSLHIACREGNFDIVKILIDNGANVNIVDNEGWSPLMRASLASNAKIVELLLKNGAKAQLLNSLNESALIHATSSKCSECINQIIENGNLLKNMDILMLKSQIADAFLIARSQENKRSQGALESFLEYASKMAPLVSKNTDSEQELLPLLGQTKINDPRFSKLSKNYILKNQNNEALTPEQQNSYTVLEDPNLPAISKKIKDSQVKNYQAFEATKEVPIYNESTYNKSNSSEAKKYKFKPQNTTEASKKIEENNKPTKFIKNNGDTKVNINQNNQIESNIPKKKAKRFKLKIGEQNQNSKPINATNKSLEQQNLNNIQKPESNEILKKDNPIIVDNKNQEIIQNIPEKPKNNSQETIVLIEKKSDHNNSSNHSKSHANKALIVEKTPTEQNTKTFKFKNSIKPNSDSNLKSKLVEDDQNDAIKLSKSYQENNESSSEKPMIRKFKLKKNDGNISLKPNQIEDSKTDQEENI